MTTTKLHVVVPVHNGSSYLGPLVESLAAQTQRPEHVHLVDNGSTEPRWPLPEEFRDFVSIHRREESLGFGAACNLGIETALTEGAECILILNQDLVVDRIACQNVIAATRGYDEVGLVGLLQLTYDGSSIDRPFRRIMPDSLIDDLLLREMQDIYECEFVPAAAVLIPASTWQRVGGFDPLYFMYQEDKDLCRRVRNAGLKVCICTTAHVRHDCGQLRAVRDHRWQKNWFYSRAIFHLKWSRRPLWMSYLTSFKYMMPRWNIRETRLWILGILKSLSHYRQLRKRREADDGLTNPDQGVRSHPEGVTERQTV